MVSAAADWWLETGGITREHLRDHLAELIWNGRGALVESTGGERR
jgi:hypothetical protein